jgi:HAD superfamily hydrolase (TIGR01509 family)
MNPFGLIGSGSMLIGCAKEAKKDLENALAAEGIPFSWIGVAEAPMGNPASSLPRFERDEILKAWLIEGLETCVFDMDGTLIDSEYDWHAIRTTLGVDGVSIIDELNGLKGEEREAKWEEMRRIEREATQHAQLRPGVGELMDLLRERRVKTALVTNNCDEHVSFLLEKFDLSFDAVISRDSGLYKPSGAPVAEAVRRLGASPEKTLCVGDSAYDIIAGRDAGCAWVCILFDEQGLCSPNADLNFPDIHGLIRYLHIAA